jgi:hypothetical protein
MNKSWEREPFFLTTEDGENFENGTGFVYGPAPITLGAFFFGSGTPLKTQAELGLCKHFDGEKMFDRMTQTCVDHYSHHLQRKAERDWGYF